MARVNGSGEFGPSVLKALGIDVKYVREFTLRCAVGEAVTVDLQAYADVDGERTLEVVDRRFEVVEITPKADPE